MGLVFVLCAQATYCDESPLAAANAESTLATKKAALQRLPVHDMRMMTGRQASYLCASGKHVYEAEQCACLC